MIYSWLTSSFILQKIILLFVDLFSKFKKDKPVEPDTGNIKRVCVIYPDPMGMGNFLQFLPILKKMQNILPHAHITLFHSKSGAVKEIVKNIPELYDEAEVFPLRMGLKSNLEFAWKYRDSFDLIFMTFYTSYPVYTFLLSFSRAPYRIGFVSSAGWRGYNDNLVNIPFRMEKHVWEPDLYFRMLQPFGVNVKQDVQPYRLKLPEKARKYAQKWLSDILVEDNTCIAIHHGSNPNQKWKRWPLEHFAEIVRRLAKDKIYTIFLGSPEEGRELENITLPENYSFNLCGKASIMETAAILEKCDLLLCNDSGLMHLAVSVNTKVLAVYGPTDYERTFPRWGGCFAIRSSSKCSPCYGFDFHGMRTPDNCGLECLKQISVDEVMKKISTIMDLKRRV